MSQSLTLGELFIVLVYMSRIKSKVLSIDDNNASKKKKRKKFIKIKLNFTRTFFLNVINNQLSKLNWWNSMEMTRFAYTFLNIFMCGRWKKKRGKKNSNVVDLLDRKWTRLRRTPGLLVAKSKWKKWKCRRNVKDFPFIWLLPFEVMSERDINSSSSLYLHPTRRKKRKK